MALKGGNYEKRPSYYNNNDELGYLETYVPNGFNVEETTNYFTVVPVPVHTIIWKNWDGTTLETDAEVEEGITPTYDGEEPTKAEDETNTYTFSGWNPTVSAVTGEATYVAQFTATPTHADADGRIDQLAAAFEFFFETNHGSCPRKRPLQPLYPCCSRACKARPFQPSCL